MGYLLGGMRYVFGEKKLRPYVWGPMLLAAIAFVVITILAYFWLTPLTQDLMARIGLDRAYSWILGEVAFWIIWWLLSATLYLGLAGILSSFLWEKLSREIERLEGTLPNPDAKVGCGGTVYDTAIRAFVSLGVAIATLLLGWLCFGAVGIVFTGWLGALDYTSCAFARRGLLIDRQFSAIRQCRGWKDFALGAGVIALFPFLNILLLPVLVAGGTLMCAKGWKSPQDRR